MIEKKTILIFCMIVMMICMIGCQKTVENEQISVCINGNNEEVLYTGTIDGETPIGEAECISNNEDGWTLNAKFNENGVIEKGNIDNYPLSVNYDNDYMGLYSGEINSDKIVGEGEFVSVDEKWSYKGSFENSMFYNGMLIDFPMKITYDKKEIVGKYNGDVTDGKITGQGSFVSDDGIFEYEGEWDNSNIIGNGNLTYEKYIVHFSDVDREGLFSGNVINGTPEGEGIFTATNDDGNTYTYTGEWADGTFNGIGERKFEEKKFNVEKGKFTKGEFTPDKIDYLKYIGSGEDLPFKVNNKTESFISENNNLFPTTEYDNISGYIDEDLTYEQYIKSPDKYGDKIIKLSNFEVVQIFEYEGCGYDHISEMIIDSNYGSKVYRVYYLGETPGIYEGSKISIYGLPVASSHYESTYGATINCIILFASYIEQ